MALPPATSFDLLEDLPDFQAHFVWKARFTAADFG
jgi:hypothetical protein